MSFEVQRIVEQIRQHPRLIIAEDFEIAVQSITSSSVRFQDGEGSRRARHSDYWVSLRLLHRKQPGRAVTHFTTPEALTGLVESAFESAARSQVDLWFRFPIWKHQPRPSEPERLQEMEYASLYPRLEVLPDALEETYETWRIETRLSRKSERFELQHSRQVHSLQYSVLNHSNDRYYWSREERAHSLPLSQREQWLEDLLRRSHAMRNARPFTRGGSSPVLLSPAVAASLIQRILPWFFADKVQSERSPLAGFRRPCALFSKAVTLVDAGTRAGCAQSTPFDLEGSLSQETTLVRDGELRDFLYDTYAATRENRLSTGNFTRAPQAPYPRIGPTNFFVQPSDIVPAELMARMERGLLVESFDETQPARGDGREFPVSGSGWRVENGRKLEPVFNIPLSLDPFQALQRVVAVGQDLQFHGACGAPSIFFEELPTSL